MPRPKRVAGLGCGKRPKFAVDYALREPGTQVSAVDLGMIGHRRYLRSRDIWRCPIT